MTEKLPVRFSEKVDFSGSCWIWKAYTNEAGYGVFAIGGKPFRAHRFAWECFKGKIPGDLCVLHKCDVRNCVNPNHLFLGTYKDNYDDMVAKGRNKSLKGRRRNYSKLTQVQVDEIRNLYQKGTKGVKSKVSTYSLATLFGISQSQIDRIVKQESWLERK